MREIVSFWCDLCQEDQDLEAHPGLWHDKLEYFWANCRSCRRKLIRYIKNKNLDPYYHRSKKLQEEYQRYRRDLIQPSQNEFKTYYKKEYDKIEEARERYEKRIEEERKKRDVLYKFHHHDINARQTVARVLDVEEKIMERSN